MPNLEPLSNSTRPDQPRHAQQEIVDLLAAALLRLRARPMPGHPTVSETVGLGFAGQERVNANPAQPQGVRP
jgi:hypothetical protein